MKKILGILLLSASFAAPGFAADKMVAAPMTNQEVVQQMIVCSAVMQINADNVSIKEDAKLHADVQASAERYRRAAAYYLRGQTDVDQIKSYVEGGIGAARGSLEAEFKEQGTVAVEKRLSQCNTPEMLAKGFEAYQALSEAEATAPIISSATAVSAPAPGEVDAAPLAPPVETVTTVTKTVAKPDDSKNARLPITVLNPPEGAQ